MRCYLHVGCNLSDTAYATKTRRIRPDLAAAIKSELTDNFAEGIAFRSLVPLGAFGTS
jgi:hypothetical protein